MKSFSSIFSEKLNPGKLMPYQKNIDRGQARKKLNWVPDSHRTDLALNPKVEGLKKQISGKVGLSSSDVIHIVNKYILQPGEDQCNISNVNQIANKYLRKPKSLGTSGIMIKSAPSKRPGLSTFFLYK